MTLVWVGFAVFVLGVLAIDHGVFNRRYHVPSTREALALTAGTVVLAMLFAGFVYYSYDAHWEGLGLRVDVVGGTPNNGHTGAIKFLTGYIVELTLSMDNVFVIALIFRHLRVPAMYQHRVLFWGVLGAFVMRGAMIGGGAALVTRYHWVMYVFGGFLIVTGLRMLMTPKQAAVPEERWIVRLLTRYARVTPEYHKEHFVVVLNGKKWITPLAIALVLVETTDLLFAVDSIPAIFAVTTDPFLVFTSNVFAVLGLRSLYFALAGMIEKFRYLTISLAVILGVVGVKMLFGSAITRALGDYQNAAMLLFVAVTLGVGVVASIGADRRSPRS